MGEHGCLVGTFDRITHIKPKKQVEIVDVTGAGDSLVGVIVAGLSKKGLGGHDELCKIIKCGMKGSEYSLMSERSVSEKITPEILGDGRN